MYNNHKAGLYHTKHDITAESFREGTDMTNKEKPSNEELVAAFAAVVQKASVEQKAYIAGALAALEISEGFKGK